MQKNTEKHGAAISAFFIIMFIIVYIGGLILLVKGLDDIFLDVFLLIYIVAGLCVIGGVIIALKQRFREINSGESEKAKKY